MFIELIDLVLMMQTGFVVALDFPILFCLMCVLTVLMCNDKLLTSLNYLSLQIPLTCKVSHAEAMVPPVKVCFLRKRGSIQRGTPGYGHSESCFPIIPDCFTIILAVSCIQADFLC